jgi:hypothetical protein
MIVNKKAKIVTFIVLSILVIALAVVVYAYQSQLFGTRADQISTPSNICITGKLKINNEYLPSKCYPANNYQTTVIEDNIYLEKGEPYTVTFVMGGFLYNGDNYLAPYMQCTESSTGQGWIFEANSYPSGWNDSLIYFLDLGINSDIFDSNLYANVTTLIGNKKIDGVSYGKPNAYDGIKRDIPFQSMPIDNNNYYSGVRQDKPRGYDFVKEFGEEDKHCRDLGYDIGEKTYYGGANQPGAFASISFTPLVTKEDGRILGKLSDNNNNFHLNGRNMIVNYQIVENIGDENLPQRSIPTQISLTDNFPDDSEDNDLQYQEGNMVGQSTTPSSEIDNIQTLVSTGSSLWFNIFLSLLVIVGLGYIMFRKDIIAQ